MSDEVFRAAEQVDIAEVPHISDHCTMSMTFVVSAAVLTNVEWELDSEHPECAEAYAQVPTENTELQDQFHQSVTDEDHEVACFCLRSMIVQDASDNRLGMARQVSVCAPLRATQKGAHSPSWFDAACKEEWRALREAVQTGQRVHAFEFVRRRSYVKDPDVHAMLRQPQHTHHTPSAQPVWASYLSAHFRPHAAAQLLVRVLV
eukprot:1116892-Pelagomonas_calceolata.AAC.1